jgi:hypothetical protein
MKNEPLPCTRWRRHYPDPRRGWELTWSSPIYLPQRDFAATLHLFRIESKRLKLSAPFSWQIAEPLDADAAGQATFYRRLNKIGREEGERDGYIDLPNAAFFASAKLSDRGYST